MRNATVPESFNQPSIYQSFQVKVLAGLEQTFTISSHLPQVQRFVFQLLLVSATSTLAQTEQSSRQ